MNISWKHGFMPKFSRGLYIHLSRWGFVTKSAKIKSTGLSAKRVIKKGEKFTEENITTKRPGTGLSPMKWDEIIGSISGKDYKFDDLIE